MGSVMKAKLKAVWEWIEKALTVSFFLFLIGTLVFSWQGGINQINQDLKLESVK